MSPSRGHSIGSDRNGTRSMSLGVSQSRQGRVFLWTRVTASGLRMKFLSRLFLSSLVLTLWSGCTILVEPRGAPVVQPTLNLSDPVLNQRRVFVVGNITAASAAETIRQLLFLDAGSDQAITLYLMTPGGDLHAAFAVERAMRQLRSPVNTCAIGECNSGGVLLLAAGTGKRTAFTDTTLVIHGIELKNKPPPKYVQSAQNAYTTFWRQHARLPQGWLPIPLGKIVVLTSQEALDYGIIDAILTQPGRNTDLGGGAKSDDRAPVPSQPPVAPVR